MKTFDYITAWHEAAKPAYESLPQNIRDLLDRTARVVGDLHQLSDCSMPWPDIDNDPGFRDAFRKIPAEWLALAARAVYSVGHWYPGTTANGYTIPGRDNGGTWKFANYADQDLRDRLGLPARGLNGREKGFGYAVHEGAIRITYASADTWMFEDVAPATAKGLETARAIVATIREGLPNLTTIAPVSRSVREKYDSAVYAAFERLRTTDPPTWPDDWRPLADTARYMIEDDVFKARTAQAPEALTKTKARILKDTAQKIADLERDRDGMIWLLDHGISVENCIYYHHTNVFTFGWREKVSPEVESQILHVISEFPYAYAIKCADGRVLEGQ